MTGCTNVVWSTHKTVDSFTFDDSVVRQDANGVLTVLDAVNGEVGRIRAIFAAGGWVAVTGPREDEK